MRDAQVLAGLFESGEPVVMLRVTHRERKGVVCQDGLDAIRQDRDDVLQKTCGDRARLFHRHEHHGLATVVIDRCKLIIVAGIAERRQDLDVDMQQLARSALFVAPARSAVRTWQARLIMLRQDAMYGSSH